MIQKSNVVNLSRMGRAPKVRDIVRVKAGRYAGRTGEVEAVHRRHVAVRIDPLYSQSERRAIGAKVAELRREDYPRAEAVRVAFQEHRREDPRMRFLVNPPPRSRTMTRSQLARMRPRDRFGHFLPGPVTRASSTRRRKTRRNPARGQHESAGQRAELSRLARSRPRDRHGRFLPEHGRARNPRRRYYRHHNPAGIGGIGRMMMDGVVGAVEVTAGKVGARVVPQILKLPTTGNAALAIQAAVGVALGYLATTFGGEELGQMILAGGLQAPLESALEKLAIPYVSNAVSGTMAGYALYVPEQPALPASTATIRSLP